MAHAATVTVDISGDVARGVAGALGVEAAAGLPRVSTVVRLEGGSGRGAGGGRVTIGLTAEDPASLRAALNSFLRWADLAATVARGASAPPAAPARATAAAASKPRKGGSRAAPPRGTRPSGPARKRSRSSPPRGKRSRR